MQMGFAFIFESVGGTEWLVLLGVILIVVGPKNLPSAARKMGQIMANLRRAADEFKRQLLSMDEEVRKTVEDAVVTDAPVETPDRLGADEPVTSEYGDGGESYPEENSYPEDDPYPGHEDYFDEESSSDSSEDGGDSGDGSETSAREDARPPVASPSDEELRAVKITVSPAPEKRK